MFAIAYLSLTRLREPAFMILVGVGCLISYWFAGLGTFSSDLIGRELLFGDNEAGGPILLGTILLVLLSSLIAVFNAAAEIPRDIDTRMIAILLSKPLSRSRYIWGKFLGTMALGLCCSLLWITFMLLCRKSMSIEASEQLGMADVLRQYACVMMLMPITSVAVAISCYFSDILAMIVTSIYVLMCFVGALFPVVINLTSQLVIGKVLLIPYYFFPNLIYFLMSYQSIVDYMGLLVYAISIAVLFVMLGRVRFERGDVF